MQWIYVLCILAAGAIAEDSFERVRRAPGKRCPRIQNFPGKVKYKRRGTRAQFRCYKTFSRYGPRFVSCRSDNTWSGEPPLCIKAGCVPIDIQHHIKLDMTESYGGALLSFKCEDEYQLIGSTEISCDSKVWSATPPVCKAPIQLTECDFEIDLCGWTQDDSDELDWIRTQGQTSTGGTGPKADHTFQSLSGHYMFVESSNPARNGDQARLLSPIYPADMGDMCFEFWYHILGPDDPGHVGTLEVYVRGDSEFIDDLQPLFVKGGNQGDVWKRGDIYIDKRDEPYQIVIVTTRKLSYISDIAIDDVRLYNCSGITTSTTTPSTTTAETTTSSAATFTISSTVTSATLSTSQPTGLPRSATTSTSAKMSSSSGTSSTGTTSLLTTTPIISPSSTVSASTPSKSSPKETTTVPVPSAPGNLTSAILATTTSKYSTKDTPLISPSTSAIPKSSTSVAASSVTTTTGTSPTRSKSSIPISTSLGSSSVTTSSTPKDKITTTISVPLETTTVRKSSSTRTTQLPVTSSTATTSTSTPASSQSTSTPKPSTTSTPKTSTVQTVKSTSSRVPLSTTTTERLTSTSTMKTSTTSSGVQTETSSTTSKLPTTNSSKVSSTPARTTPASTETSTRETTSLSSTGTTLKSTLVSLSTHTKLKTTSSTTVKSSSETPTITVTSTTTNTQKSSTTEAILNKTVSPKISTTSVKGNKTVSTESKVTTVESNNTEPVVVAQPRSQHPADETLRPLMIGLGVGIVAGLIIIGVVAWVCVRRRKFYTSRYEDELKPITKSSSNENFNNIQYEYHDDEEYQ